MTDELHQQWSATATKSELSAYHLGYKDGRESVGPAQSEEVLHKMKVLLLNSRFTYRGYGHPGNYDNNQWEQQRRDILDLLERKQ